MRTEIKIEKVEGLRECPFCGDTLERIEIAKYDIRKMGYPYTGKIRCSCGASMSVPMFYDTAEDAINETIKMWNGRENDIQ